MTQYNKLADIYDYLVAGIDYEEWADYIELILEKFACSVTHIADLACGTGNTTLPLAARGYSVYGVDLAEAMLSKAREKAEARDLKPVFLRQDMRRLDLPRLMDLVTCYHDGINYIIEPDDLREVFRRVYDSLHPQGLFIFDLNAVEKLKETRGDTTFLDDDEISLIWETDYDRSMDTWEIKLTGFIRRGDLYEKFVEVHKEKAHKQDDVLTYLEEAGFRLLDIYHGFSLERPKPESRRVFFVVQRP